MIGLGNPTAAYRATRHNFGFQTLDRWVASEEGKGRQSSGWKKARYADALEYRAQNGQILLKPQTYMNLSGGAVQAALHWWKLAVSDILVVVDDVALPLGRMRLRASGSCGGHNGLRSIESALGTQAYPRLRLGIAPKAQQADQLEQQGVSATETLEHKKEACFSIQAGVSSRNLADFVLDRWAEHEMESVHRIQEEAVNIIQLCAKGGFEAARTRASHFKL